MDTEELLDLIKVTVEYNIIIVTVTANSYMSLSPFLLHLTFSLSLSRKSVSCKNEQFNVRDEKIRLTDTKQVAFWSMVY